MKSKETAGLAEIKSSFDKIAAGDVKKNRRRNWIPDENVSELARRYEPSVSSGRAKNKTQCPWPRACFSEAPKSFRARKAIFS